VCVYCWFQDDNLWRNSSLCPLRPHSPPFTLQAYFLISLSVTLGTCGNLAHGNSKKKRSSDWPSLCKNRDDRNADRCWLTFGFVSISAERIYEGLYFFAIDCFGWFTDSTRGSSGETLRFKLIERKPPPPRGFPIYYVPFPRTV